MPRFRLHVEYAGTGLAGWQKQADVPSVQQQIEEAVRAFSGEAVTIRGAGRTDAGVHATAQIAHLDLEKDWPTDTIRDALNHHLRPTATAILSAEMVDDDFDARFSATKRAYVYKIVNRRPQPTLQRGRVWQVPRPLDVEAMQAAADSLMGTHDFTTFRSSECQAKSPVKTLDELSVHRTGDLITIHAVARSFLHNQIRSFVGSLKRVGEGVWPVEQMAEALEARDRKACGPVAPPDGLYLMRVDYPDRSFVSWP
ncbi:tRNA pseudouridine(38-40) synthase TruA [Coralliovum pocilloporae]|uniref:tRNA pseudouridine(38-40) synthase TruA n=1 Tax=Coralliovum pocilloporae TaxID=3066369 RepID=UPI003306EB16